MLDSVGRNLLTVIVLFVIGVVSYVVVVGGILCILDKNYDFAHYLDDLSRLQPILVAAVIGAVGRELAPALQRRNGKKAE